jgi:hypothetical protein
VVKVCEIDNHIIVIKYIRAKRVDPPTWWPESDQGPYDGHEDTYLGMMMDIDCPYDTLGEENSRNPAGYDDVNHIAWQQGFDYTGAHPEYNSYYAGMALADPEGNPDNYIPYGSHNVKNNAYLYPQSGWGWDEDSLYALASRPGVTIQDVDSLVDRSQVMTAVHIPAGNDPTADYSFVVVEAASPNGLSGLQELIDTARVIVVREVGHGFPIICGDANGGGTIDLGDIVSLLNYLFKEYPLETIACPSYNRADCNGGGTIDLGDIVTLLNYLFKGYGPETFKCPGLFGP